MTVVEVGVMRVFVQESRMLVHVCVGLAHGAVVLVLVVNVVAVAVLMLHLLVQVLVLVALREVKPKADGHQCSGNR